MTITQAARELVASRYVPLTDSMGREHPSIPARAILAGAWDNGALVREAEAGLREGRE